MTKPDFLLSKHERRLISSSISVDDIEMHYRDILRGLFVWEGLPDDMPVGFVDADALYVARGFGLKDVSGLGICGFPCNPVLVNIYGEPVTWLAQPYGWAQDGRQASKIDNEIFTESDTPALWIRASIRDRILPYIQIMARALQALGNNVSALNHPILISGNASGMPGDNIGSILLKSEYEDGTTYLPVVSPGPLGLEAIDLQVTDNTQNLASIVDWCDSRILEIIGASTGVEKSSGISTMETASGKGGLGSQSDAALALRRAWCEKVNAVLGTNITVRRSEIMDEIIEGGNDDESMDDDESSTSGPEDTDSETAEIDDRP